jgi:hypothetical protein
VCVSACVCTCERARVCMFEGACVCERVCVCTCERARVCMCEGACVCERVCVCTCERARVCAITNVSKLKQDDKITIFLFFMKNKITIK